MSDQSPPPPTSKPSADRFTWIWLVVFGLFFLFGMLGGQLDYIWRNRSPYFALSLLSALVIGCFWLVVAIINIAKRRWRRLVSQLVAPVIAYPLCGIVVAAGVTSERIRFEFGRAYYENEIAKLPKDGAPRFRQFDWGGGGLFVTTPYFHYALVFDESDEIGRPPEERSAEWRARRTPPTCLKEQQCAVYESASGWTVTVSHLTGHFFVVQQMSR